jgi:steroid delta-isomerase-like uncharacterized protein
MSTEHNKAIVSRFIEEIWNQKNLAQADVLLDANYIDHTSDNPPGPEGLKQFAEAYISAFPDLHTTIEDQVAEGDKVVTRWTSHGTNTGSFFGKPATGKSATIVGMSIDRIADGKIVESWDAIDQLGMLQQLEMIAPSE